MKLTTEEKRRIRKATNKIVKGTESYCCWALKEKQESLYRSEMVRKFADFYDKHIGTAWFYHDGIDGTFLPEDQMARSLLLLLFIEASEDV